MTIYEILVKNAEQHRPFFIDLDKGLCVINGKNFVKDFIEIRGEFGCFYPNENEFKEKINSLYREYKFSTPCKSGDSKYFTALSDEEFESEEQMACGSDRIVARARIEGFILGLNLCGFKWNESTLGKHFYKSKEDKDLIVLKSWITERR